MKQHILNLILFLFLSLSLVWGQAVKYHYQAPLNCSECHDCEKPTHKRPCLKLFPDFKRDGLTLFNTAGDVPELIIIDTLSKIYDPSIFTHKLHAEMSDMSGGCATCHHFNPPGKVLACITCHEPSKKRDDINKPGLTGAYHQQCLNCHREWSHKTDCVVCHSEKGSADKQDKSQFVGKSHTKVEPPVKRVYQTEMEDGPLVTFFHNAHTDIYNLKCIDCHKDEACSRCHDVMKTGQAESDDPHEKCMACHESDIDENCEKCHDTKEKKPFNHKNFGFDITKNHSDVACKECHKGSSFKGLNKRCTSCHKNWTPSKFNHAVTGLRLDEIHIENDCSDCHVNRDFSKKPFCNDCHDDFSYPAQKPGKRVGK